MDKIRHKWIQPTCLITWTSQSNDNVNQQMVYTNCGKFAKFYKTGKFAINACSKMNPDAELDVDGVAKLSRKQVFQLQVVGMDCSSRWYPAWDPF